MAQNNSTISRIEFDNLKEEIKDLKKVHDIVQRQTVVIERLTLEMKFMREDQSDMSNRLRKLEEKPVKRYDNLLSTVVSNVVSAIVGAIAVLIGLSK